MGKAIPCVFALLPNKGTSTDIRLAECLKEELAKSVNPINVSKIIMDFENGLNRAFQESFPQARVQGCNFHWKTCFFKKLRAKGLMELYNRDADFHLLTRYIWALSFIPEDRVIPLWEEFIRQQAMKNLDNWLHITDELKRFLKYIDFNWIGELNSRTKQRGSSQPKRWRCGTSSRPHSLVSRKQITCPKVTIWLSSCLSL
jgi:hypothetical protein